MTAEVVKVLMSHVNSVPLLREEALISGLVDACINPTDQQLISYAVRMKNFLKPRTLCPMFLDIKSDMSGKNGFFIFTGYGPGIGLWPIHY